MADQNMSEHVKQLLASAAQALRPLVPRRLRGDMVVVPVVRLAGIIGVSTPLRPGLMLSSVGRQLDRAFAVRGAGAVARVINSPGGSAVQSHLIDRRMRALTAEQELPLSAFAEDVAASGAYVRGCAADQTICDRSW